jgi:pimeloyl-ACP methyl ester carboxylesterase
MIRGVILPLGPGQRDTVVSGVRWRSRETEGRGAPVVYVHGLLASSATWQEVLRDASAGRPAIAVDLPGFGGSDRPWPHDYTVGGEAADLLAFLDARGIDRAILVGNSLGGAAVSVVAAEHPQRVAALVLVSPATAETRIPWTIRALRAPVLGEVVLALASRPFVAFGLHHRLYANGARVTEQAIEDAWFPLTVPGTRRAALAAARSNPRIYSGIERRIRMPTLIVWGAEDRLLPARGAGLLASRIAGASVAVIPDAGHLPQREQPRAFSRAVAAFLSAL